MRRPLPLFALWLLTTQTLWLLTTPALWLLTTPAVAQETANSELVFRHTARELEKLARAHLLMQVSEIQSVLKLPDQEVRKLESVAVVTARRFVKAEDWGDSEHRKFFEKVDGRQFKTFRLQNQRVSLQTGEAVEETEEVNPVAVWFEMHDQMILIGLQWGRFVNMYAVYVGLDTVRSDPLWQKQMNATLTAA